MRKAFYTLGSLALSAVSFWAALSVPSEPNGPRYDELAGSFWDGYSALGSWFFGFVGVLWLGMAVLALTRPKP